MNWSDPLMTHLMSDKVEQFQKEAQRQRQVKGLRVPRTPWRDRAAGSLLRLACRLSPQRPALAQPKSETHPC